MTTIGVVLPPDLPSEQVLSFIRRADDLGFDELWVVEDCFFRGGIGLAALALSTTARIRVGLGILPAGARNAAFMAMEVATLATLYPGRLVVGIGHGQPDWMRQVGAWPASPVTLLGEQIVAVRDLLHGRTVVSLDNRYVRLDDVRLDFAPSIPPMIYSGVRGPKSLAATAEIADGILLAEPVTPEYLQQVRKTLGHGRASQHIAGYHIAAVSQHGDDAVAEARTGLRWVGEPALRAQIAPLPFADELVALRRESDTWLRFVQALPESWVRQLAVTGTPEQARLRLGELSAAGCASHLLIPVAGLAGLPALASLLPDARS